MKIFGGFKLEIFLPDLNFSARKILKRYSDYPLSKSYRITAFNLKHWFNEHNLISIASVKSTALLKHFVTAKDIQVFSLAEAYFPFVNDRCHL